MATLSDFCPEVGGIGSIGVLCDNPVGYEGRAYIFKRADVDFASIVKGFNGTEGTLPGNVVTAIALIDGKKGYTIDQLKNAYTGSAVSLATSDYRNTFTNTVSFQTFDQGPNISKIVTGLANGEYVMVLEQKAKDLTNEHDLLPGNSAFRVFGLDGGLTATAIDQDPYAEGVGNGFSITLEETNASQAATYLLTAGSAAEPTAVPTVSTTKAWLESVCE